MLSTVYLIESVRGTHPRPIYKGNLCLNAGDKIQRNRIMALYVNHEMSTFLNKKGDKFRIEKEKKSYSGKKNRLDD